MKSDITLIHTKREKTKKIDFIQRISRFRRRIIKFSYLKSPSFSVRAHTNNIHSDKLSFGKTLLLLYKRHDSIFFFVGFLRCRFCVCKIQRDVLGDGCKRNGTVLESINKDSRKYRRICAIFMLCRWL